MQEWHVPAVSVAVAEGGTIVWAQAFGVTDAGSRTPVTSETPFQASSLATAFVATVTLRLVAEGKLSLSEDVNRYIDRWQIPTNQYTEQRSVTLRDLLSHSAGTTVNAFVPLARGQRAPTLIDLLEGRPPALNEPVRVIQTPGTLVRFSAGGTLIEQLVLEDRIQRPLAALAQDLVFTPLGLKNSTFQHPLPADWEPRIASGHDVQGQPYPQRYNTPLPMLAFWSTPSDLLRWAIAVAEAQGKGTFLPAALAEQMVQPTLRGGATGLGTLVFGEGDRVHFGYGGHDDGYASEVLYFPKPGRGLAVMVNGDGGYGLLAAVRYAVAAELHWPSQTPLEVEGLQAPEELLNGALGTYVTHEPRTFSLTLSRRQNALVVDCPRLGVRSEAVFLGKRRFITVHEALPFALELNGEGRVAVADFAGFRFARP
jgi:CubicO group peptidase (beta-lactamase class C family)